MAYPATGPEIAAHRRECDLGYSRAGRGSGKTPASSTKSRRPPVSAFENQTSRPRTNPSGVMTVVERIAMGVVYALVIAFVPLSAFGLLTRTAV